MVGRVAERAGDSTVAGRPGRRPGELAPGDRVRDYLIQEVIAAGGFGTVYRAEHAVLGRAAALKVMHRELAGSAALIARFEREARAVNLIRHPNVVDIYEFGRLDDGRPFLVMELLRGVSLARRVAAGGPLPAEAIGELLGPLAGPPPTTAASSTATSARRTCSSPIPIAWCCSTSASPSCSIPRPSSSPRAAS
jgi:serine/threonine-protein kinase